jgi:hypothetical protein
MPAPDIEREHVKSYMGKIRVQKYSRYQPPELTLHDKLVYFHAVYF